MSTNQVQESCETCPFLDLQGKAEALKARLKYNYDTNYPGLP